MRKNVFIEEKHQAGKLPTQRAACRQMVISLSFSRLNDERESDKRESEREKENGGRETESETLREREMTRDVD